MKELPREILLSIFSHLIRHDLKSCLNVCRSWYSPARVRMFRSIFLLGIDGVNAFIYSIDNNDDCLLYSNQVKEIHIKSVDPEGNLDPEGDSYVQSFFDNYDKIFFRFPNLEAVFGEDSLYLFQGFNDNLCKTFLECCPKLNSFQLESSGMNQSFHHSVLCRTRLLTTGIDLKDIDLKAVADIPGFLSTFPRLGYLECHPGLFEKFGDVLPILKNAPTIDSLNLTISKDDKVGLARVFTETMTEDQKQSFFRRLLDFKSLAINGKFVFYPNSLRFIAEHMKKLDFLYLTAKIPFSDRGHQPRFFCAEAVKFVDFVNYVDLTLVVGEFLQQFIPLVVNKTFHQTKSSSLTHTPNRILKLSFSKHTKEHSIRVTAKKNLEKCVSINYAISDKVDLNEKVILIKTALSNTVDEFIFGICNESLTFFKKHLNCSTYNQILEPMPSLKKITLGVDNFKESEPKLGKKEFPLVLHLALNATANAKIQALLDWTFYTFPNLKRLDLNHFSGIWESRIGEFRVQLEKHTLERLVIDMTPVLNMKPLSHLESEILVHERFFVLDIEYSNNTEGRQLYKVSLDLLSRNPISYDEDLKELVCGEDYLRVHIKVKTLQRLDLCFRKERFIAYNCRPSIIEEDPEPFTLFDKARR